jgi:hypothetical protein
MKLFKHSMSVPACVMGVAMLGAVTGPCLAAPPTNSVLTRLAADDQADRLPGHNKIDWSVVGKRDAQRRAQVLQWLADGDIRTADDYFHAALIFQHGDSIEDTQLAFALATTAVRMAPSNHDAQILRVDAWDRIMQESGKPQWYGTQYVRSKTTGKWELYPTDPSAVTDAQRKAIGLPSLSEAMAVVAQLNK